MNALATMTRSWPMLGALGAGLVLAALAAGAGGAPQVALAGLGVAALGWGALSLHAGRILASRAVLATAATALVSLGLLVTAGAMSDAAVLPLAAASTFIVAVALSAALTLRLRRGAHVDRSPRPRPIDRSPRPRPRYRRTSASPAALVLHGDAPAGHESAPAANRGAVDGLPSLLGLLGGAVLVAALATPALAATEAGRQAQPHGEHAVLAPLDGEHAVVRPLDGANDPGHAH
jgi:hypothetical protein